MTVINVNPLSNSSIEHAEAALVAYKKTLAEFPYNFMRAMAKEMDSILKGQAPPEAQGLWNAYAVQWEGYAEAVIMFEGRVEFIEFGTGIVGKKNHEGINEDWLDKLPPPYTGYNQGPSIVHFDNENYDYWVYREGDKGIRTQGVPADPFIYRSFMELKEKRLEIAKYVLNNERYVAFE